MERDERSARSLRRAHRAIKGELDLQRRIFLSIGGRIALASAALLIAGCGGGAGGPATPVVPDDMQLFLLMGQSNMEGRGFLQPQDVSTNPGIWMLTKSGRWTLARDPIHYDRPAAGVGPGHQFARTLKRRDPGANIGLVPAAVGATSLDEWQAGGTLYQHAVARARVAIKNGELKGILWHQGEADLSPEKIASYPRRFAAMIAQLRLDLGAPNVPVIIGELPYERERNAAFNATIPTIAAAVPNCAWVSAKDLPTNDGRVHFSSASARKLGERYAEKFLELRSRPTKPPRSPATTALSN